MTLPTFRPRRLRTDTIDVYWYHRPDRTTPIADQVRANAAAAAWIPGDGDLAVLDELLAPAAPSGL